MSLCCRINQRKQPAGVPRPRHSTHPPLQTCVLLTACLTLTLLVSEVHVLVLMLPGSAAHCGPELFSSRFSCIFDYCHDESLVRVTVRCFCLAVLLKLCLEWLEDIVIPLCRCQVVPLLCLGTCLFRIG